MAYATPGTVAAGDVATAAAWNVLTNDVIFLDAPPMCRAYRAAAQTVLITTNTFITFDTESFDTDTMFTASSDSITIKTAGVYLITAGVKMDGSGAGTYRASFIMKNPSSVSDTASYVASQSIYPNGVSFDAGMNMATTSKCSINDVFKVMTTHNRTTSLDTATAGQATFLSATWIGFN